MIDDLDPQPILDSLIPLVTRWGVSVISAMALLVIGLAGAKAIRAWTRRAMFRSKLDKTLVPFLSSLVYYGVLTFVVLTVLRLFGFETASLIAVVGAAGLAIGLALQGTLSNFAAGLMLLIFRPFKIGDFIEAGGTSGAVHEIGIFAITLDSPDNVRIVVPNSAVYGATIKNYNFNETRRIDLVMSISYADDIGKAMDTLRRVVTADPRVLSEPAPTIAVSELGDSSVNLVVRPWCKTPDYWKARFDLIRNLKEELEAAGCSIPFPQRDVHLHQHQV